jgi:glutamate-1-semialdehyde 2,1-aminomutase
MLDRGFLGNTAFYPTASHEKQILDDYIAALDETFAVLADAIAKDDVVSRLRGPIVHSGFTRLT